MKFVLYFLIAYIVIFNIIPSITTLIRKLFYYLEVQNICKKNKYIMVSSLRRWLFSSIRKDNPEMFIKTEKAIYSIKNYGFYKTPNYYVLLDRNNIEIQVVRMIFWIGFAFLKSIKIKNINYTNADKYFGEHNLPVINIILFCPKCAKAIKLTGNSAISYVEYVNTQNTFKIFGKVILKVRSIIKNPYVAGLGVDNPVYGIKGVEGINLSNGDMVHGAYIYNIKSFIRERLCSSDMLVHSMVKEERRKFESRLTK